MLTRRFATAAHAALRAVPSLGLAAALLFPTLGPPASARADPSAGSTAPLLLATRSVPGVATAMSAPQPARVAQRSPKDKSDPPVARLEVVIKKIIIHDDRDWGEGEFRFTVRFGRADDCTALANFWGTCLEEMARSAPISFGANDYDARSLSVTMPRQGDTIKDRSIAPDIGIPVRPNHTYGIEISGVEVDPAFDDPMGWTLFPITLQEFWGEGTHTLRGKVTHQVSDILDSIAGTAGEVLPSDDFGWQPAHYTVELEIRRVPLPDLIAQSITPLVLDDGWTVLCPTIANTGQRLTGPVQAVFRVDGVPPAGGTFETP